MPPEHHEKLLYFKYINGQDAEDPKRSDDALYYEK